MGRYRITSQTRATGLLGGGPSSHQRKGKQNMDTQKPISIGRCGKNTVYFDTGRAPNRHILVTGKTGSGKSVEAQKIILETAKQGGTVVIPDIHSIAAPEQIFDGIKDEFSSFIHDTDAYRDGIPCGLFSPATFPDGEEESPVDTAGAVVDMVSRSIKMGSRHRNALRKATNKVMETGGYEDGGFASIDGALENIGTREAEDVRDKLYQLTAHNVFRPGELFIQEGRINIVRLSKFDSQTQEAIAEMLLSYLWRLAASSKFKEGGLSILADECQNLLSGKGCALNRILTEGRKFNLNLILVTQELLSKPYQTARQQLTQSGLTLSFQPGTEQVKAIARLIDADNAKEWAAILNSLGRGEFVAIGSLSVGSVPVERPLRVSAK